MQPRNDNNLTFVRWVAALMVLYGHSFVFTGNTESLFMGLLPYGPLGVAIFFSISGFLIARSWNADPSLIRFLIKRVLRIFPALAVCITLSVFVLGPIITTFEPREYLQHPATLDYLSNVFLYITYYLPGVFENNLYPNAVNGSLWSLPVEFFMYLLLAATGVLLRYRWAWVSLLGCFVLLNIFWIPMTTDMLVIYRTDARQIMIYGAYFWMGVLFSLINIEKFSTRWGLTLTVAALIVSFSVPSYFALVSWVAIPYIALKVGLANTPLLSNFSRFDYSYGLYIYAFPVQQTLSRYRPEMAFVWHVIIASVISVCLAALSWHLIEKRALGLKPYRTR
jgi:peptidoglycan/LPS O-acetylase OafA/YrhL